MLTIRTLGDKVLTQKAKRVSRIDDTIKNLCASMIDTMISSDGIGLAGNQVGVLKRIIVILDDEIPKVLINPEIVEFSKITCDCEEGCLSIPDVFININRPEQIKVKYRDIKGKPHLETYDGIISRVIQHEIDHLDGITMDTKIINK